MVDKLHTKYLLSEDEMPRAWYNIAPDLPRPPEPVLHPGTKQPVTPDDLAPLFPMALIMQEVSAEPYIEIPEPIRQIYTLWRPSPLYRARRLEKALDTPARIYYKYEGVSPVGSHKLNTAVAQVYYNQQAGVKKISTETGAGQWGSALALAGAYFGVDIEIFMVKISYQQKPYRRNMMETYGAAIHASPSNLTNAGRSILAQDPDNQGSLGIAISEAVEVAATSGGTVKYSLGSVLNHVLMHQTIIGEEALKQMALADDYPDVVIGCAGGGSNMAGLIFPFIGEARKKGLNTRFLAAEPMACPSLTRGIYAYDFGDTVGMTPLVKMHTLGHDFMPPGIHAGGLRYHGMSPLVSLLHDTGILEAEAFHQISVFDASVQFARAEGILPAPESGHAIRAVLNEALEAKKTGQERVILFNLSGHGHFDMGAYEAYFSGKLQDYEYPAEAVAAAQHRMPQVV
ncbi:MAG: TrpB-like pyridoxal phosphate-dependent enzyme [Chloroflexi bacterium]|nr:MAG: TrpB-like pyridoxal-phosphate dependent enzyme [Ktedonobacter sp. 13_2_20CM_2_56_8]TMC18136.1 MAG: TrpB-like pyridoxal phosphate-dependent enzyme [Chloroflexota bacterium]TMC97056.1 MAG: TrpB-like pyridoxal phosphate-dependent enzyme [Chloroflexota bacterium]TME61359.1 MAG: TrpB-like pyridoxal phosphate-dependent enzyme [Chloroflexota bacterium]